MDQSITSLAIVKPSKGEDKGNGQSSNKLMVAEPAVDFRPQFTRIENF
jgi:hypothetical protein